MNPRCGLVLLTGGRGTRLGGPKHDRPHPWGGSWGGHLVSVFAQVLPGAPIQIIGEALPEFPALPRLEDPCEGPAVALQHWANSNPPLARRWWVAACDQVRWTSTAFEAWLMEAEAADPSGARWIFVERDQHPQPLGGFLGSELIPELTGSNARSLHEWLEALPSQVLPGRTWVGEDLDTPEDLAEFQAHL